MSVTRFKTATPGADTPLILNGEPLPTENLTGVEVFAVGRHNGEGYSDKQIDELIDNTNLLIAQGLLEPPMKIGHADDQTFLEREGFPAAGWITRLYRVGEKVVADISHIPQKLAALIKSGAYRKVSSEVWRDYGRAPDGKDYGHVLKAVAFLGEEIPAVGNLDDILRLYKDRFDGRHLALNVSGRRADEVVTMTLSAPTSDEIAQSILDEFDQHIFKIKDSTKGKVGAPQMRAILAEAHAKIKALMGGAKKNTALGEGESLDVRRSAVQAAVDAMWPPNSTGVSDYSYIEALFTDHVVVSRKEEYLAIPYTIADGAATLGAPQPVEKTWTPESAAATMARRASKAATHSDKTIGGEPPWSEIDLDDLPAQAFAKEEGGQYAHHAMSDGALYLHLGGLRAALKAARSISTTSAEVFAHLAAHAGAVGLDMKNTAKGAHMDPKTLAKALGLTESASETDILAAITANVETATKYAEAAREVETFREKAATTAAESTVAKAIADKKVIPAQKAWATKFARKDPEGFTEFLKDAPTRFSTDEKGSAAGGQEGEGDARSTLNRLAIAKVSEGKGEVSYLDALNEIKASNPDLAKQAAAQNN